MTVNVPNFAVSARSTILDGQGLEDIRARQEVNYDALIQAGAIDVPYAIERLYYARNHYLSQPEGQRKLGLIFEVNATNPYAGTLKAWMWVPTADEDAGDILGRIKKPSRSNARTYFKACCTKRHITVLVQRALRGYQVPMDVRIIVNRGIYDKEFEGKSIWDPHASFLF